MTQQTVEPKAGSVVKTVALDRALPKFLAWKTAEEEATAARARADALKAEFQATMSTLEAGIGTIAGVQVLKYAPTATFRGKAFEEGRPDLAEQYRVKKITEGFDLDALRAEQPDVYAKYQSRALKPNWKALVTAAALKAKRQ